MTKYIKASIENKACSKIFIKNDSLFYKKNGKVIPKVYVVEGREIKKGDYYLETFYSKTEDKKLNVTFEISKKVNKSVFALQYYLYFILEYKKNEIVKITRTRVFKDEIIYEDKEKYKND